MYRFAFALFALTIVTPVFAQNVPPTILRDHNGGIISNGPDGATSVTPDHQGGGTIMNRDGTTRLIPDGIGGFTPYGPTGARRGLRDSGQAEPRELLGGTRPPSGESLRGGGGGLR